MFGDVVIIHEVWNFNIFVLNFQIETSVRRVVIIVMPMRHVLILKDHSLALVTLDIVEME